MEKANQDEEKGDGSTQTQEEEGKAAWVEAPWHKFANINLETNTRTVGPNSRGALQDGSSTCAMPVRGDWQTGAYGHAARTP